VPWRPAAHDIREPRDLRQPVHVKAVLHAHGKRHGIEIIDYSQYGLGIKCAPPIQPDERVTVELRSGLRLPMIVLWAKRGGAGLRFLGPIAPGHTVMRSLEEAARRFQQRRTRPD
jgi:hypothetical protein